MSGTAQFGMWRMNEVFREAFRVAVRAQGTSRHLDLWGEIRTAQSKKALQHLVGKEWESHLCRVWDKNMPNEIEQLRMNGGLASQLEGMGARQVF